jgi:predicted enzyme related to lactoylglutathione lyase
MSTPAILCWTDIPVTDLDRAITFYSAVLDAEVTKQSFPNYSFATLPHAGESPSGCLTPDAENAPSQKGPLIYLSVCGRLDDALAKALEQGGTILQEKHQIGPYGFRGVILDSEGNRIALHSQTE